MQTPPEAALTPDVRSARRLVLLFDGTWNRREDTTNVWRMKMLLRHGPAQLVYYDEGVGTDKGAEFQGGAFGQGLSSKVLNGYLWLLENYEDNLESETGKADEIFVFGFSRGAFTARSLVGLLAIAGLLHRDAGTRVKEAFSLSRIRGMDETHAIAQAYRAQYSRDVRIRLLGVWDTVGSLGFPKIQGLPAVRLKSLEDNALHKVVDLPTNVDHARHALALDEQREIFSPTLWPKCAPHQTMEQRWFVGAHANIGGGYEQDSLFLRPLQWMQAESEQLGLSFRKIVRPLNDAFYNSAPRDSVSEIGYGAYFLTQNFRRYDRPLLEHPAACEWLDYTVLQRWLWSPAYSPRMLNKILGPKPAQRPSNRAPSTAEILDLVSNPLECIETSQGYPISITREKP